MVIKLWGAGSIPVTGFGWCSSVGRATLQHRSWQFCSSVRLGGLKVLGYHVTQVMPFPVSLLVHRLAGVAQG